MTGRLDVTKSKYGSFGPYVRYQCFRGRYDPGHQRPYMVTEAIILPWIEAEAARQRVPEAVELAPDDSRRDELEQRRRRVVEAFIDGLIDKNERDRRLVAIVDELEQLQAVAGVVAVPAIDWSADPADLNRVLRALWHRIELGPDLRPVRAEWTVPEWRQPD